MLTLKPVMVVEPAETFLVVAFVKLELVAYCSEYPEAFATLPTVTETVFELVALTFNVGVDSLVAFAFVVAVFVSL